MVPLTPTHGLVEWVNNTLSLSEYLLLPFEKSAHARYRHERQQLTHSKIHALMRQAREHDLSNKEHGFDTVQCQVC